MRLAVPGAATSRPARSTHCWPRRQPVGLESSVHGVDVLFCAMSTLV